MSAHGIDAQKHVNDTLTKATINCEMRQDFALNLDFRCMLIWTVVQYFHVSDTVTNPR